MFSLLKQRTFFPTFMVQFFGAFNDNAFKLAMLTLISYHISSSQDQSEQYQAIASALFIIPFFIFSATAGQLADMVDKALLIKIIKAFEILLMLIGGLGLYMGYIYLLMATLTGLGIHSTFFGPIKYAILPDHLPKNKLLGATSLIESSTFIAILCGTIFGTLSVTGVAFGTTNAFLLTIVVAILGFISSCYIPPAPSHNVNIVVDFNIWRATLAIMRKATEDFMTYKVILALSWYWLVGSVFLIKLPDYTNYVLHGEATVFALFLAIFSIGVAVGSLTINYFLKGKTSLRFIARSMVLLSIFAIDLYWSSPENNNQLPLQTIYNFFMQPIHWRISFDLFCVAFSGGLFVVPLYTYLQVESISEMRARTIAANNIYNALFMASGSFLVMILIFLNFTIPAVFLFVGISNAVVALMWVVFGESR